MLVNSPVLRAIIIYIFILINSLGSAQVDSVSLQNIPSQKCTVTKYPIRWNPIDYTPPQNKVQSVLTDIVPEAYTGLRTEYLGRPVFEKITPESVETKKMSRTHTKDVATLDIQYFKKRHGLPGNSVYTVGKGPADQVTFGTGAYLNIYDGLELTSYLFNDSIGEIRYLSMEHSSHLWVSTTSGVYYQDGDSFYALKNNWGISFWSTTMDQQGTLWMTSYDQGVYFIKNDSLFQLINDEIQVDTKEVYVDSKDQIWLASMPGVIRITEKDTVIFRLSPENRSPSVIKEFENKIYVGLFLKGMRVIENDQVWDLKMGIDKRSVSDIEVSPTGLWFTPYGRGLWLLQPDGHFRSFTHKEGLAGNSAHKINVDKFGNIWVAGFIDGLSIFSEINLLPNYSLAKGIGISQIEEIPNTDTTWFMFVYGPPTRIVGEQSAQMIIDSSFADVFYHQTASFVHGDKAWFQAYEKGVIKYEGNAFYSYEYSDDPQDNINHQITLDRHGRVWAINLRNELRYLSKDSIYLAYQKTSPGENKFTEVKHLVADTDREFYFSRKSDLHWVQKEHLFTHNLGDEIIKIAFPHEQKGVWVLTDQNLYHLHQDEVLKIYEYKNSKRSAISNAVHIADQLYLVASDGFWSLQLASNELIAEKLPMDQDLTAVHIHSYLNTPLLTAEQGNYRIKSWWNADPGYLPELSIQSVVAGGEVIAHDKKIQITQDDPLVVHLQYMDWGKNSALEYQLKKDDQNVDWIPINDKRLSFENLSAGNYQLSIRASNQSKEWIGSQLAFGVSPFWYESQWFFLLLLGVILIAFYFIYRYRVRQAKAQELQLQNAVDQKTKELASEKKQVEKQLHQKELLLKEVNHRVMNNMQMVSSILELQHSRISDEASKANLMDARDRIKALALAHQHLYKNEQYETIKVLEYLSVVEKSLRLDQNININLDIHPDLILPIERAQSLGLVLNELISNSIKHAWNPGALYKQIDVELTENDKDYYWEYTDNGQGLDSENPNQNGLGTRLINAITTRQLSGDLEFESHEGFKLKIKFPKS